MIRARQHWMVFVRPGPVFMIVVGSILAWAAISPVTALAMLHVTRSSPSFVLWMFREFYENRIICVGVPLAIGGFMILTAWGLWFISYFVVDDYGLTYRTGPFGENTIPLRAIQDIRTSTSPLGLMFGYGTLVVDSGREEERLFYVPRISEFVAALRRPSC